MGNFNAILSTITVAALVGLLIMNPKATADVFSSLGANAVNYVQAVQGR
jgi:hypothetical protein